VIVDRASDHVLERAVAFDELRLLYAPVPKAGSTAVLWALAGAAKLTPDDFARSRDPEVTRELTVHDLSIWGRAHALRYRRAEEANRALTRDDWFRFTIVREPVGRIWSAWVSKLLVRDPQFTPAFAREDWFPSIPETPEDIVDAFRRFVLVLPSQERLDPHWRPQVDLVGAGAVDYAHVGRFERLDETLAVLEAHVEAHGRKLARAPNANPSLLPFEPALLDDEAYEVCASFTARDRETFGYEHMSRGSGLGEAWLARARASIPGIVAVIERNERIGDMRRFLETPASPTRARSPLTAARAVLGRLRTRAARGL
jgi:hypothetical protein